MLNLDAQIKRLLSIKGKMSGSVQDSWVLICLRGAPWACGADGNDLFAPLPMLFWNLGAETAHLNMSITPLIFHSLVLR